MSEEKKRKLKEYQKNYHETKKIFKKLTFFLFIIRNMEQEAVYFKENGIIKSASHKNKRPIKINEINIEEILLSHKKSYSKGSFKYFIGY